MRVRLNGLSVGVSSGWENYEVSSSVVKGECGLWLSSWNEVEGCESFNGGENMKGMG